MAVGGTVSHVGRFRQADRLGEAAGFARRQKKE